MCYLLFAGFVCCHVTLQLRAAAQGVAAERAAEALLVLLVPILDVFLQRRQAFVAALTVRTGEQLGEVVRCVTLQLCTQSKTDAVLSSTLTDRGKQVGLQTGSGCTLATVLALLRAQQLRCAPEPLLLWGFWVNDGSVAALQVLGDGHRLVLALLRSTLQEVGVQFSDAEHLD